MLKAMSAMWAVIAIAESIMTGAAILGSGFVASDEAVWSTVCQYDVITPSPPFAGTVRGFERTPPADDVKLNASTSLPTVPLRAPATPARTTERTSLPHTKSGLNTR